MAINGQVTVDEEREARARAEEEVNTLHERYSDFGAERERMDLTNSELARQIKHLEGMRDRLNDEKGALGALWLCVIVFDCVVVCDCVGLLWLCVVVWLCMCLFVFVCSCA